MALDFPDSPSDGQFYEGFVYSSATGAWRVTKEPAEATRVIQYVVIGGGGKGGNQGQFGIDRGGGGGGAGGYRSSMSEQFSGRLSSPEQPIPIQASPTSYALTVGAGGGSSTFGSIVALAGGLGGNSYQNGGAGGSGGGGGGGQGANTVGGAGTTGQGTNGNNTNGSGGGAGTTAGGIGLYFVQEGSITRYANGGPANSGINVAGAANTGNGGNGGGDNNGNAAGGQGGSGIIFFMVPTGTSVSFSAGVVSTNFSYLTNTVYKVTVAGPTSTVTIG